MTHLLNRLFAALLTFSLALAPALANDLGNSTFSETDASNNSASPNGWTSGSMLPSQVEPTARALAGALKRFYNQINATATSGGAANVQTLAYSVATAQYYAGQCFNFFAGFTNTSATTLNVNGLGAKSVFYGGAALLGGEIQAGQIALVCYDSTQFQLLTPAGRQAFLSYTATATCQVGSATSLSGGTAYYKRIPGTKAVIVNVPTITMADATDCLPNVTLPIAVAAAHGAYQCYGQIAAVSNLICGAEAATSFVVIYKYDNTKLTSAGPLSVGFTMIYETD